MGRDNKEKWLKHLKDSVLDHSEPLPDNFWEELDKDIPAPVPVKPYRMVGRVLVAASVAAVVLALLLLDLPKADVDGTSDVYVAREELYAGKDNVPADAGNPPVDEGNLHIQVEKVHRNGLDLEKMVEAGNVAGAGDAVAQVAHLEKNGQYAQTQIEEPAGTGSRKETVAGIVADRATDVVADVKENENDAKDAKDAKERLRDEHLKELEYLYGNDRKRGSRERSRMYMAFAGGNAGIKVKNPFKGGYMAESSLPQDSHTPSGVPSSGTANMSPTIAGFVNMDYQPASRVEWVGTMLNASSGYGTSFTSCEYDHSLPVRFGVAIAKEVADGIFVESGVSYQYLKSRMHHTLGITQKLHYLGIPVRISATVVRAGGFSLYLAGGYLLEKCIYGTLEYNNGRDERLDLQQWQNSLNASVGMQLQVGGGASLYLEPGAYWYLGMKNGWIAKQKGFLIKNTYSEDPEGFSFQGGLRFAF